MVVICTIGAIGLIGALMSLGLYCACRLLIAPENLNKYGKQVLIAWAIVGAVISITYYCRVCRGDVECLIEKTEASRELYDWALSDDGLKDTERTNLLKLIVEQNSSVTTMQYYWKSHKAILGKDLADRLYSIELINPK